jgi:prostaglandin-E synthase 1
MTSLAAQPAFVAYVISAIILSLNLLLLWAYSGVVRGKAKSTPNEEDAKTIKLSVTEPPEIARVLRAHANAMANIVPFLVLALVYVLAGGSAMAAQVIFGVFTAARIAHSFAYLGGKQPWRSLSFGIGALTTLVLIGFIVRVLVAG